MRTAEYRANVNEMGEVPVLVHGAKKLSQSGVILTYLAERSGKFLPRGEDERLEALRWIIFDNQKLNGSLAPYDHDVVHEVGLEVEVELARRPVEVRHPADDLVERGRAVRAGRPPRSFCNPSE